MLNDSEFTGNELKSWRSEQGIIQQTSAARTPEPKGKAERDHRTTVEAVLSLIHATNLYSLLALWVEAIFSLHPKQIVSKKEKLQPV